MVTTIQLENTTLDLLRQLKRGKRARSYDEVIRGLISENKISYWGFLGKKSLAKIMVSLRDEKDRF